MTNLDRTFAALANPKRRAIVARLVRGEASLDELAEPFGISMLMTARHLKVLEKASLVTADQGGKHGKCHLRREGLASAAEWIDFHRTFWNVNLDLLNVRSKQPKAPKKKRSRNRHSFA